MKRAHLFVSGRVQGVFYRQNTKEQAQALGLKGWVRNLPDGRVEVMAEGEDEGVNKLVKWCHDGPPHARVEDLQVQWLDYLGEFDSFSVTG